jgi:glycosyltransferase involved in cell wall biosynthesis
MDGLSYLSASGITPEILDSSRGMLNPLRRKGTLLAGIDPARLLRTLWKYRHYDVLIAIDSSAAFLFVQLRRALGLRKPVVVIDPALDPGYLARMKLHRMVLPHVDRVIVFTRQQVEFLQKEYRGRVAVSFVHHRIDSRFFDPRKSKTVSRCPYVLAVGNDISRDFDRLLEAVDGLPIQVILQTSREFNRPLPSNVIVQRNWISFEDLRDLYANAVAVVLPLHDTLHPGGINSVLEAMSMGRPLIVSGSRGVADYVAHGDTAWVVPPEDTAALRAGLERVLGDASLRESLGRQARAFCESSCAMPVYAAQIAAILKDVTGR